MLPSLQSIFSTPSSAIGRVEKATNRLLINPDWMMNMEICNSINSDPWKAKSFVKAVKVRLQNNNSKVQFLSLELLETMINKCDDFVHFQVVERGILQEMVRILRRSKNMLVREKILVLLESWQKQFRGPDGRYPQFYNTYVELKKDGIQFPVSENNTDLKPTMPITKQLQIGYEVSINNSGRFGDVLASATSHFSLSDLYNTRSVMELLTKMLQAVNPKDHKAIRNEVITDLKNQCDISQKKLVQLINSTENDNLLVEALSLNDSLQVVLSQHDALLLGSSSLPKTANEFPKPSLPPPAPEASFHDKEEEEEDDDFSIIAKRKTIHNSTVIQEVSDKKSEQSNAIVLFDPPSPVISSSKKEEEDMIDLLSLSLSVNQSPPLQHLSSNQTLTSDSLSWEHYLNHPQPLISNESYNSYNSYIAPWARPAIPQLPEVTQLFPLQKLQQHPPNYLPSPWSTTEGNSNPFLPTNYIEYQVSQPLFSTQKFR